MRLLVTGAGGQLGWELSRSLAPLGEIVALGRSACDLARPKELAQIIHALKPNIIVNAAAYTAVDKAEEEEELATTVNGTAVGVVAEEARKSGALLIHYSTDYIFDGAKNDPYTEDDMPCPINAYGRSKIVGEKAIRQSSADYIVLRTSWIFAARGRNFLRTILRLADERDELRIVADQIGAPTWARDIAGATALIIDAGCRSRRTGGFVSGFFNLTASGCTSWHGFAEAILGSAKQRSGLSIRCSRVSPISSSEYPTPAARPKNSRLACDRISRQFGIVLPDWRKSLSQCIAEIVPE